MHINSIAAYHEERANLSDRETVIYEAMLRVNGPMSDRDILFALYPNGGDMNMVRPRITELMKAGFIIQEGSAQDQATGKTVRRTRALTMDEMIRRGLAQNAEQQELF